MAIFDGTKVDIISLSTNKKYKKVGLVQNISGINSSFAARLPAMACLVWCLLI